MTNFETMKARVRAMLLNMVGLEEDNTMVYSEQFSNVVRNSNIEEIPESNLTIINEMHFDLTDGTRTTNVVKAYYNMSDVVKDWINYWTNNVVNEIVDFVGETKAYNMDIILANGKPDNKVNQNFTWYVEHSTLFRQLAKVREHLELVGITLDKHVFNHIRYSYTWYGSINDVETGEIMDAIYMTQTASDFRKITYPIPIIKHEGRGRFPMNTLLTIVKHHCPKYELSAYLVGQWDVRRICLISELIHGIETNNYSAVKNVTEEFILE